MSGRRSALAGEGARYAVVGAYNVVFTLAVFWLLDTLWGGYLGVQAVYWTSAALGIVNGFITQRFFVWRARGAWRGQLLKFTAVNLSVSVTNSALLFLLVTTWRLPAFASQVAITGVLLVATFVINRQWVFRRTTPRSEEEGR